jgi:signal transduction histidine kinase
MSRRLSPAGDRPGRRERVMLHELASRMLALREFAARRRVTVRRDLAEVTPIRADPDWATEAVYLLIRAAFGLVDESGRLAVRTYRRDDQVLVETVDNGRSLTQDDIRQVLDPYTHPAIQDTGPVPDLKRTRLLLSWMGGTLAIRPGDSRGNLIAAEFPPEALSDRPVTSDGARRYDLLVVDKPVR